MASTTMQPSYQISSRKIAHQNIDGEIIVIHFDTGCYYSLSGTAAALWQMLDKPRDAVSLRARFADQAPHAERFVSEFIRTLAGEGLIEATAAVAVPSSDPVIPVGEIVIEKY